MTVSEDGGEGVFRVELFERDGAPIRLRGTVAIEPSGDDLRVRSGKSEAPPEPDLGTTRGSVDALQTGGDVRVPLEAQLPELEIEWDANLSRAEAGRYAENAMVGTYEARGGGGSVPLTRGVVILWQFR